MTKNEKLTLAAGLTSYRELKRLADNIEEWKKYEKLQNQR